MFIDSFLAVILVAGLGHVFFGITMTLTSIFLILLVLVQRGRGGGLAGAFGGMGGQSAFGTKAGDAFTKVTIGVSIFWILLCIASVKLLGTSSGSFGQATPPEQTQFIPGANGGLDGAGEPLMPGGDLGTESSGTGGAGGTPPAAEVTSETPVDATQTDASTPEGTN